jgi:hypothetical protein
MKNNRMDDDELLAVLMRHENTESVSTGNGQSQQAYDRAAAHRRYLRRPQGDEQRGVLRHVQHGGVDAAVNY